MLVSVVVPAYNASRYVAETVRSVLGQTHAELELIVIDDGSTDGTADVARAAFAGDPRAHVHSYPNAGLPGARNRGLALARGEFLATLDADDRWVPEKLAKQLAALRAEPDTVCVGCLMNYIGEDGRVLRGPRGFAPTTGEDPRGPRSQELIRQALLLPFQPSSILYRTAGLRQVGGWDASLRICGEDFELLARISALGAVGFVPEPLGYYRLHADSMHAKDVLANRRYNLFVISRHQARMAGGDLTLEQYNATYRPGLGERRMALALQYSRQAGMYLVCGRYLAAARHFAIALAMRPTYPIARLYRSATGKGPPSLGRRLSVAPSAAAAAKAASTLDPAGDRTTAP